MNYSFFLFSKLYDLEFNPTIPYDEVFDDVKRMYKDYLIWDGETNKPIGDYEAMQEFLKLQTTCES